MSQPAPPTPFCLWPSRCCVFSWACRMPQSPSFPAPASARRTSLAWSRIWALKSASCYTRTGMPVGRHICGLSPTARSLSSWPYLSPLSCWAALPVALVSAYSDTVSASRSPPCFSCSPVRNSYQPEDLAGFRQRPAGDGGPCGNEPLPAAHCSRDAGNLKPDLPELHPRIDPLAMLGCTARSSVVIPTGGSRPLKS